jgi:hypothetical protein
VWGLGATTRTGALAERFKCVRQSTVTLVRRGASLARVAGEVKFDDGFRLVVVERVIADRSPAVIDAYGYEICRGTEKLCWYDCQPHPDDPTLQPTHPHHKHDPPEIKHQRVPAPQIGFVRPNLPELISEAQEFVRRAEV